MAATAALTACSNSSSDASNASAAPSSAGSSGSGSAGAAAGAATSGAAPSSPLTPKLVTKIGNTPLQAATSDDVKQLISQSQTTATGVKVNPPDCATLVASPLSYIRADSAVAGGQLSQQGVAFDSLTTQSPDGSPADLVGKCGHVTAASGTKTATVDVAKVDTPSADGMSDTIGFTRSYSTASNKEATITYLGRKNNTWVTLTMIAPAAPVAPADKTTFDQLWQAQAAKL